MNYRIQVSTNGNRTLFILSLADKAEITLLDEAQIFKNKLQTVLNIYSKKLGFLVSKYSSIYAEKHYLSKSKF